MEKAKIYIEGGGRVRDLRRRRREGFLGKRGSKTLGKHLPSFQRCQRILGEKL